METLHGWLIQATNWFPFWNYAHHVNAVTVLIAMVLFVGALKLIAKFANVLLVIALGVLAFHYFVR